jgi:hypothetical protein
MVCREWRRILPVVTLLIAAGSLPYLIAWLATPADAHFTGLIFNPQDGGSYLAKMRQGYDGSWLFHLVYTPEPHTGAYIYLYYLALGHLARWLGLSLPSTYHVARLLGGIAMLVAIYRLAFRVTAGDRTCAEQSHLAPQRSAMVWLVSMGGGLGWLLMPLGVMTPDLWVIEAFPWYALLANAHFPVAIALMATAAASALALVSEGGEGAAAWRHGLGMSFAVVALGLVQPFGLLPVFGGAGSLLLARSIKARSVPWRAGVWVAGAGLLALPYPIYMQWAIRSDPILAAWNAQNATPSPPLWQWLLSYGFLTVLAAGGAWLAIRRGSDGDWLLVGWLGIALIGMYLPIVLQRRLSLGLGVPVGMLAAVGWWHMVRPKLAARSRGSVFGLLVAFSSVSMLFLVLAAVTVRSSVSQWSYLMAGERPAMMWLRDAGQSGDVVLCAPETGLLVPAWAGQRVVYGHPFETVDAEVRRREVTAYWSGDMDAGERESFLRRNNVGLILVGPRELALGDWAPDRAGAEVEAVFATADVHVYRLVGGPE